MADTCTGVRRDGTPCRAPARPSGFCLAHDPALADARSRGRRLGGQGHGTAARLRRAVPPDMRDILQLLITSLHRCAEGTLEPRAAGAMAGLSGAIVRAYEVAELALRITALEERYEAENAFLPFPPPDYPQPTTDTFPSPTYPEAAELPPLPTDYT